MDNLIDNPKNNKKSQNKDKNDDRIVIEVVNDVIESNEKSNFDDLNVAMDKEQFKNNSLNSLEDNYEFYTNPDTKTKESINLSKENIDISKLIYSKSMEHKNSHNCYHTNLDSIQKILNLINQIIFRKIMNGLDQNKVFLDYFKEIMNSYQKFSIELIKSNIHLQSLNHNLTDKKTNPSTSISSKDKKSTDNYSLFSSISGIIEKSQKGIANNFLNFSLTLNQGIISKGPFVRIKELYNSLQNINKIFVNSLVELTELKEKIAKINKDQMKIHEIIIKASNNNNGNNTNTNIVYENTNTNQFDKKYHDTIKKTDFFTLEVKYYKYYNKSIQLLRSLLTTYKNSTTEYQELLLEFVNLIKETIGIYLKESMTIFSKDEHFINLKKINDTLDEQAIIGIFKPVCLFNDSDELKVLNSNLVKIEDNITHYKIHKDNTVYKEENYCLQKYNKIYDMITFLELIVPQEIEINKSNLIKNYIEVRRDPGFLSKRRTSIIIITVQNNLIIYDFTVSSKPIDVFDNKNVTFGIKDESKFQFDLIDENSKSLFKTTTKHSFEALNQEKLKEIQQIFTKT